MKKKIILLTSLGFLFIAGHFALAETFNVNTTSDTVDVNPGDGIAVDVSGDCSLRAAIMEANALAGKDTILLPEGVFALTIEGAQEDECLTGDLDILSSMVIQGEGWNLTIIDGNQIDRVFHIEGNKNVSLFDLTIQNGKTPDGSVPPALTVGGSGGGIFNRFATLNIENCKIINNETGKGQEKQYIMNNGPPGGYGGGIYNKKGTVSIKNSIIRNNMTGGGGYGDLYGGSGGKGGGIYNCPYSQVTLDNCIISQNLTGEYGRGGWEDGGGGGGGGINNNEEGSDATLLNCTIYKNIGHEGGGGIFNDPYYFTSSIRIKNTIIADNYLGSSSQELPYITFPDDCTGIIISMGYNLIKTTTVCRITGISNGNIYSVDPLLGDLADNGGSTMTHRLHPGSPAIDAGHSTDFEITDQRGVLRPKDGDGDGDARSDIGAFELFSPAVTITSPVAGETVSGTVSIEADANTEYVDFFIDNMLLCESVTPPFLCTLDTILFSNGNHRIKGRAYDVEDSRAIAQDKVNFKVDNTLIDLSVSNFTDKAWIIKREYGRVAFEVTHAGFIPAAKFVIERREEAGTYSTIIEVDTSELTGNSYAYNDPLPNGDISYAYRVRAVDSANMTVGMSKEATS